MKSESHAEDKVKGIDFPLRGVWKIFHIPGHHRNAYDFVGLHPETLKYLRRHVLQNIFSGGLVEDWYGWGQEVFSPCRGVIDQAEDGWTDHRGVGFVRDFMKFFLLRRTPSRMTDDPRSVAGNFVTIRRSDNITVFLCHLKRGSIKVRAGDAVKEGDPLAEVGNSGNPFSPHLHFNLFAGMDKPLSGKSILAYLADPYVPSFCFNCFERWDDKGWKRIESETPEKGAKIRSC